MLVEACVDSVDSGLIAAEAGADRLELCSALIIGGLTPTRAVFCELRKRIKTEIRVLIRPRFGDFLYSPTEFEVIKEEVRQFREEGADGVVIGILKEDGSLDGERMEELVSISGGLKRTLHRAFDVCKNPFLTLEEAVRLKIDTILTSGQEAVAVKGAKLLTELKKVSGDRITIMAGSGIDAKAVRTLYLETGITHFHLSGKKILESGMKYRKEGVPMGLPSFSEFELWQTDASKIREAKNELKSLLTD